MKRIAVIGHVALEPDAMPLPDSQAGIRHLMGFQNYLRVVDEDNQFRGHLSCLSRWRGQNERFSIWDIRLTAPLLLATHLRNAGFDARITNSLTPDTWDGRVAELHDFDPELIVLSTTFVLTASSFQNIADKIREWFPSVPVIAGGQHLFTTLSGMDPEGQRDYLRHSNFDAFVLDVQGETTLVEFCRTLQAGGDLTKIPNLIIRQTDGTVVTTVRLAENNDINLSVFDMADIQPDQVAHVRTARSCSFKCAFCTYPAVAGPTTSMGVEQAMTMLRRVKEQGGKQVVFTDDTFNVPPERFGALVDAMIAEKLDLQWYSFLRCQYLTEDLTSRMRDAGCQGVFLGIESGADSVLKMMKKGAVSRFYRDGIRWMKERDIKTFGAFIIGFPGETDETVEETYDFIESSGLDYFFLQMFYYLHNAPIHQRAKELGLSGEGFFWSHNSMNWRQASAHVDRLFHKIQNAVAANPDFNMWEYAYLRSRGLNHDEYRAYRLRINAMTRDQMARFSA